MEYIFVELYWVTIKAHKLIINMLQEEILKTSSWISQTTLSVKVLDVKLDN